MLLWLLLLLLLLLLVSVFRRVLLFVLVSDNPKAKFDDQLCCMRLTQPNSVFKVSHGNDIWSKALTSSCLRNCICVFSDPVQANASAKAQSFSIQIHIQHAFLKPTVALSDLGRIKICIFLHVSIGLLDASLLPSQSCHRATDQ